MSIDANTLRKLAAIDMPAESLRAVMNIFADIQASEEARKTRDRDRKRAEREAVRGQSVDGPRNEDGQSEDCPEDSLPPSLAPFAPPMRDKNSTPPQTPIPPTNQIAREASFDRFWKIWPNRVGRPAARRAYDKHWLAELEIIAGVERYILEKPPDRPWLNPATFLNQERWKDQPAAVLPLVNGKNHGSPKRTPNDAIKDLHEQVLDGAAITIGPAPVPYSVQLLEGNREGAPARRLLSQG